MTLHGPIKRAHSSGMGYDPKLGPNDTDSTQKNKTNVER
jgi:hypothetical protein